MDLEAEQELRRQVATLVSQRADSNGGFLTRPELDSFPMPDGTNRRLIDNSRGIWNPRDLAATLAVVSSGDGPYNDTEVEGGLFRYDYRAGSDEGDNTKLRRAYELQLPIIFLRKVASGVFMPVAPTYVVGDDRARRQFLLTFDETLRLLNDPLQPSEIERRYAERVVHQRLHQAEFRVRVLRAYGTSCAVCRLRHVELLDAAHIVADGEPLGQPVIPNGLAMCKIHHAAYDNDLLGISPDLTIAVNAELLHETDGPMLRHGLQAMDGQVLHVPSRRADRPDRQRLGVRYQQFLNTA